MNISHLNASIKASNLGTAIWKLEPFSQNTHTEQLNQMLASLLWPYFTENKKIPQDNLTALSTALQYKGLQVFVISFF